MRTLLSCLAIALFAGIVGCGETTTPPPATPATTESGDAGSATEGDAGSATEGEAGSAKEGEAGSSTSATAVPEGMVKVSLNVPAMS